MLIACIVNVTLNAIMIPFLGYMGAAIATLLTEILNVILFWYYSKDFLKEKLKKLTVVYDTVINHIPKMYLMLVAIMEEG